MSTWNKKPIDILTDDELRDAYTRIKVINDSYKAVTKTEQYKEKMKNRPLPDTNPSFVELFSQLQEEVNKRNLVI